MSDDTTPTPPRQYVHETALQTLENLRQRSEDEKGERPYRPFGDRFSDTEAELD